MTVEITSFLGVAQSLMNTGKECHDRSSVSRSYYAAYHACVQWEKTLKAPGSAIGEPGGIHQQLVNRLMNPAPEISLEEKTRSKILGGQLNTFKAHRHFADYHLNIDKEFNVWAKNDLENIKLMIEKIEPVIQGSPAENSPSVALPLPKEEPARAAGRGKFDKPSLQLVK